ncbi:hypothetical protein SO802_003592 [Lithocarpus litseifolius]|uniref:RNase H type-1 domain-containing protein n=1 Tax=Lithocarpus litseifolius TaxID=425828 RepID=A0AAW2E4F0_9ROSI
MFNCRLVFWDSPGEWFAFEPTAISSFFDLVWHLIMVEEFDEDKVATVVTIAWSIWANHNEVRHGGIKKTGAALVKWSAQYLDEYRGANSSPEPVPRSQDVKWSPPPRTRYKINVDGAVFKMQKSAGVGVLIRDEHGQIVAALSQKINAPLGALEVEAKAVEIALQFARDISVKVMQVCSRFKCKKCCSLNLSRPVELLKPVARQQLDR